MSRLMIERSIAVGIIIALGLFTIFTLLYLKMFPSSSARTIAM